MYGTCTSIILYYYYFQFAFNQPTLLELFQIKAVPKSKLLDIVGAGLSAGCMSFLVPNQQCQITKGSKLSRTLTCNYHRNPMMPVAGYTQKGVWSNTNDCNGNNK